MIALKLREILSRHKSNDLDCARALVEAFADCNRETLEDAFVVSLRTGTLGQPRAKRLLVVIDELSDDDEAMKALPGLAGNLDRLKSETNDLTRERRAVEAQSKNAAARQLELNNLALEMEQLTSKETALCSEIESMVNQIERLNTIAAEVLYDTRSTVG